jgi:hypothetical protein
MVEVGSHCIGCVVGATAPVNDVDLVVSRVFRKLIGWWLLFLTQAVIGSR